MNTFRFLAPSILFGTKSAETLAEHLKTLGASRVLIVSDRGLEKAGVLSKVCGWITQAGLSAESYSDIEPEPSLESVRTCMANARQSDFDAVVGLGGGSAMDVAKTVAMLLGNQGDILDYLGQNRVPHKGLPLILLPTTAGTGSEIGRGALFYVPEHNAKESIFSPHLLADLAIIDPALTISCPPHVTAASGIDALSHAIESYTNRNASPLTEPYAERGIEQIARWLALAVADGSNLEAREGMALGSLYASISLANSNTHAVHALAYPLQGHNRIAHGLANGVLLPYVLDAIVTANPIKFSRIAELMGVDCTNLQAQQASRAGIAAIRNLSAQIGIPEHMGQLGVKPEQLVPFAAEAYAIRRLMDNCPCELTSVNVLTIFESAL